jgi:hypothetical protein
MIDNIHPSRTGHGTMKISQISTGLVFERQPPDASDCVATGAFEYASRDAPSIAEILSAKSRDELLALCTQAAAHKSATEPVDALVTFLVPLVEAGTVTLS